MRFHASRISLSLSSSLFKEEAMWKSMRARRMSEGDRREKVKLSMRVKRIGNSARPDSETRPPSRRPR